MNPMNSYISDEESATPSMNESIILSKIDCYNCSACSSPVEILSINDKENSLTFKCLNKNKKDNHNVQTMLINEYINSMKKHSYLYSECYICKKIQYHSKNISVFSYCIKCDKVICDDCMDDHLKCNEKIHPNMSKEFIIKNNEKGTKCLFHPREKNIAFCFYCNIHLCNECLKSRKHITHRKNNLVETKPNEKMIEKLNGIISIYAEKIKILSDEKDKKQIELYNKLKKEKKFVKDENESKIKKIKNELKNELIKQEKILNEDLYKLKINYEKEIKLRKNMYNIIIDNINKKYEQLEEFHNSKTNEELEKIQKEFNETMDDLYNIKIKEVGNLLLINNIFKKTQENYEDNYYNNYNIYNIISSYCKSEDPSIKKLLNNGEEIQLINNHKEEQKYKVENTEVEKLKNENSEKLNIIKTLKVENEKLKSENTEKTNIINCLSERLKNESSQSVEISKTFKNDNGKIKSENGENLILTKIFKDENEKLNSENSEKIIINRTYKNELEKLKNEIPEKFICKIKTDEYKGRGFLCNIPNPVLIIPDGILQNEDIEIGKEILIIFYNESIEEKLKIDLNTNINIIDKLRDADVNIIIIDLNKNEEIFQNREFFEFRLFGKVLNDYLKKNKNELIFTLTIIEEEVNKKIYFLDNTNKKYGENEKEVEHKHDNLQELNVNNTKLYINNEKVIFNKFFIPTEKGIYEIKLEFKTKLKNCSYMFCGCKNITKINLSSFNTQNVTDMKYMFHECFSLSALDLSSFNTENVTDMQRMFFSCIKLKTLNLESFKTEKVTNMRSMFNECSSLMSLDLSSFNTQNVTSMYCMFYKCSSLLTVNLKSFNTQNVIDMESMFEECSSLETLNLFSFNTENVTNMKYMFKGCSFLTTLNFSSFNIDNADNKDMFVGCKNLFSFGNSDKNNGGINDKK